MDVTLQKMESPSAIWCFKMEHQTKVYQSRNGCLLVTDNVYIRHVFLKQFLILTNGDVKMLGTIRMITVDAVNCPSLKDAIQSLEHASRERWLLVHVLEKEINGSTELQVEEKCGYVLFKDRKVVFRCTKDLAATPRYKLRGTVIKIFFAYMVSHL